MAVSIRPASLATTGAKANDGRVERMESIPNRRRAPGGVAMSPEDWQGQAVRALFRLYAGWPDFRNDLRQMVDSYRASWRHLDVFAGQSFAWAESRAATDDDVQAYVTAVRTVTAKKWGLDRIVIEDRRYETADDPQSVEVLYPGIEALHRWMGLALADSNEDGSAFGFGHTIMGANLPNVDTAVGDGDHWLPDDEPLNDFDEPLRDPDPNAWRRNFRHQGARSRFPGMEADLARIQAEYEDAGFVFPDTQDKFARDLSWAFERLALSRSVWKIVELNPLQGNGEPMTEEIVREGLDRMRRLLGISTFPKAERKPRR